MLIVESRPKVTDPDNLWRKSILPVDSTIHQALDCLDRVALKIVLIADAEGRLQGTISDGDIRWDLLKGLDLDSPISSVMWRTPLVVPIGMGLETVQQLMVANKVHQIPVVDDERRLEGLHLRDEIVATPPRPNLMVIMAGGKGTRLRQSRSCPSKEDQDRTSGCCRSSRLSARGRLGRRLS